MTSASVVDSAVALGWSLEDEADATADATLAHVERHGALVPALFRYEIANVLALLVRGGGLFSCSPRYALWTCDRLCLTIL